MLLKNRRSLLRSFVTAAATNLVITKNLVIKVHGQSMERDGMYTRNGIYRRPNTHFPKEEQWLFEEVCYNIA
jgi:hypothetical protein